jgi:hypothetical protein
MFIGVFLSNDRLDCESCSAIRYDRIVGKEIKSEHAKSEQQQLRQFLFTSPSIHRRESRANLAPSPIHRASQEALAKAFGKPDESGSTMIRNPVPGRERRGWRKGVRMFIVLI